MSEKTNILTDSFGREHTYLRISLTEKCNLRCTYCMPEEGIELSPKNQLMTSEEVINLAQLFVDHGVSKIRLTGGEPLLRKDFPEILRGLSKLKVKLSLTTNAILVDRHIELFKETKIGDINVSLDTLQPEKFFGITKRDQFQKAYDNIMLLLNEGFNVKLNVVLIKGFNEDEINDFVQLTKNENITIRFIEFMPFDGNRWDKSKLVTQREILEEIHSEFGREKNHMIANEANFIARNYRIQGHRGIYGIISSVSNPFCDGCNRIRLTANGKIKNCLFSGDETDLLTPFRNQESIEPLIAKAVGRKKAVRAGMNTMEKLENPNNHSKNRSMIAIGG